MTIHSKLCEIVLKGIDYVNCFGFMNDEELKQMSNDVATAIITSFPTIESERIFICSDCEGNGCHTTTTDISNNEKYRVYNCVCPTCEGRGWIVKGE